jgi:hypothetical protein
MEEESERLGLTYGCRHLKILVEAITEADPERRENTGEAHQTERKPTRFDPYTPHGRYRCVDSHYLGRCAS